MPAAYNPPVLGFREAIRKRPGMFIGSVDELGLHSLIDGLLNWSRGGRPQAMIEVSVTPDLGIRIYNDGVGPLDPKQLTAIVDDRPPFAPEMQSHQWSLVELDPDAYWAGWGASDLVVAAELGDRFSLRATLRDGVTLEFHPDARVFGAAALDVETLRMRMRELAFLQPSATWTLIDERSGSRERFAFPGGASAHVRQLALEARIGSTLPPSPLRFQSPSSHNASPTLIVDAAVQWTHHPVEEVRSYVNEHRTLGGGTHETAFRDALDKTLAAHDLRAPGAGIFAVINVQIAINSRGSKLQFAGSTKDRLDDHRGTLVGRVVESELARHIARGTPFPTRST